LFFAGREVTTMKALIPCLLFSFLWTSSITAAEPPALTTLSKPKIEYQVPDAPFVKLSRGGVTAVVVNNEAVDNDLLPGHRAGYSGVASLSHDKQPRNLFVPSIAGLNFEHIHDGTTRERDILFEPRKFPMELRIVNDHTVELYQPPTGNWKLESCTRYAMLADGTIEMTFECIPRADTYKNGYIGLFWASYIHAPESKDIHFYGMDNDQQEGEPGWIRGITPKHGVRATHIGVYDHRRFAHDDDFPLSLVFNRSQHYFAEPWYYGVSHGMAYVLVFRDKDQVRLSQSPSGGGKDNPAWDFQWFIEKPEVGKRYQLVMRAAYVPFESPEQIQKLVKRQRKEMETGHRIVE
jgi:hypothetical protein